MRTCGDFKDKRPAGLRAGKKTEDSLALNLATSYFLPHPNQKGKARMAELVDALD